MNLWESFRARPRPHRPMLPVVVLLLSLLLSGCVAWAVWGRAGGGNRDRLLKFSHARHARHGGTCDACHPANAGGEFAPAGHSVCVTCHPAAAATAAPGKGCLLCHYTLTPTKTLRLERPDYAAATFGHPAHSTVACGACHGAVNKARRFREADYPRMEECLTCHFPGLTATAAAKCRLCHPGLSPEFRPTSHAPASWRQTHGHGSQLQPELCQRCHVATRDCDECHRRERPMSHNAGFRLKTHGFNAMSNPMSCETCHQQDFCDACHRTTQPPTHTASFKFGSWQHCAVCHLPLEEGNRCSVCHRDDPHARVVARGPPPALVANGRINLDGPCLPCHLLQGGPRIPHPYNSVTAFECIQCHRPR